jgi:dihydroorotate dehydrogenase (NAD+) catalytic subunit
VVDLSVQLGPLRLEHPLINASGTMELFDLAAAMDGRILAEPPVAAYVPKTVTVTARAGNPSPRIVETLDGMINAVGLPSKGLEVFVADELLRLLALPIPLILSIGGFSVAQYVALADGLRQALDGSAGEEWTARVGLELNISCPNVHSG